ncbi:MAG: hypothetical protein V3W02_01155, partial [Gammaproteobacteria bacterium]
MFYAYFPTTRIAQFAVLATAVFGLLAACGVNPPQTQPSAAQTMPLTVTQRPVSEQRLALAPIGSGRSPAIGQAPAPQVLVNPRHPEQYVVRPGDTLWDISELF